MKVPGKVNVLFLTTGFQLGKALAEGRLRPMLRLPPPNYSRRQEAVQNLHRRRAAATNVSTNTTNADQSAIWGASKAD